MKTIILENTPLSDRLQRTMYFVKKEDLKQSAEAIAAAFRDDPAIRYLLGGETTGDNDWRYFFTILQAVYGKCLILSSDQAIQNLLVLFPPRLKGVPVFRFFMNGGIGLCRFFGPRLFIRSLNYENNCQRIKDRFLTPNTWYCMCFVVRPEKQGQGMGSRLIKPVLQAMDDYHIPLYLETHKETNTRIYEHLGFHMVDISVIPGTNTAQYAMLWTAKG